MRMFNITTTGITTLIKKINSRKDIRKISKNIHKITISNNSPSNPATVSVQIWDGSSIGYNIIGTMVIPNGTVLVLKDNLSYDFNSFDLRMEVTGTSPVLDVIIT